MDISNHSDPDHDDAGTTGDGRLGPPAPRRHVSRAFAFAADSIGSADPEYITDAMVKFFRNGQYPELVTILQDGRWFQFIVTFKGSAAQNVIDILQYYSDELTESPDRQLFVRALIKLSRSSGLYPQSLVKTDIRLLGTDAIAAGRFGDVWKATDSTNELLAVKILRIYEKSDAERLSKEFSSEIVTWRQLSHPNVLAFHGVWHPNNNRSRVSLVSPWMENGNLVQYLKKNPSADHVGLILNIAEGLKYLHESKPSIVHGDLKGVNILITPDYTACLADFGLATAQDSHIKGLSSISSGKASGTCRWQAPEILDPDLFVHGDQGKNTRASDMYSFACICYEVYSGNIPFHAIANDYSVMFSVTKGNRPPRPPPESCKIHVEQSTPVWSLIQICWAQSPKRRPTAGVAIQQLQHIHSAAAVPSESLRPLLPQKQTLKLGWAQLTSKLQILKRFDGKEIGEDVSITRSNLKRRTTHAEPKIDPLLGMWLAGRVAQ